MKTLTKAKSFLSSWKNLLALVTLLPLGVWTYSRVWMVNPAILGDEYLYSMNSRKVAPWDPSPAGDFSNYLFNFVYQTTNLCGQSFYSCAKILNIVFFLGFVFTLFIVAIRFLPFWAAYSFMIAAALSPLSVYTSMFLPESMYMFFIALLLVAVLRAMNQFTWQNWALAGAAIGIASLVKPHAWLSALAVGITLLVVGLGNREIALRKTLLGALALIAGASSSRIFIGLIVAGPKALGFFGQYFGVETVGLVLSGSSQAQPGGSVSSSPMSGVANLFGTQITIHFLVISAIMAISVAAITIGVLEILKLKRLSVVNSLALFSFIWIVSLMIEIVIFTGWVTGSGDDHTSRVLLRYYEFLFAIVPLAGLSVLGNGGGERANVWIRWGVSGALAALVTPAFTGFFNTLTIQIADAPTLAGLVVNSDVFNGVAVVGFMALIVLATFPKYAAWTFVLLLPFSMVGTGWQIQTQYQIFRGDLSIADKAGQYLRDNFSDSEIDDTLIISSSRFDATNIAIWADRPGISYEILAPGSQVLLGSIPDDIEFIISDTEIRIENDGIEKISQDGFSIFLIGETEVLAD
jgi:hypothetical protein